MRGCFNAVRKAAPDTFIYNKTVNNDFNIMLFIFFQLYLFKKIIDAAVYTDS